MIQVPYVVVSRRGHKHNFTITISAIAAAWVLCISTAWAAASPEAGHRLAQQWCSSCHQVDATDTIRDFVPSFPSLANRPDRSLAWVRLWLMDPHPPMVGLNLSRAQIDNVIAYLQSLQSPPADLPQDR